MDPRKSEFLVHNDQTALGKTPLWECPTGGDLQGSCSERVYRPVFRMSSTTCNSSLNRLPYRYIPLHVLANDGGPHMVRAPRNSYAC